MQQPNTALVPGSLGALAKHSGASLAETFINADVVILVDVSGSMDAADSRGGKRRYDVALEELATLQASMPGKIAILAFSSETVFVPGGQPPPLFGGTDLAKALTFAKQADTADIRFVVISDGQPDEPDKALRIAANYAGRIDVIYVGSEGGAGWEFLQRLAKANGGQAVTANRAQELATKTQLLLTT